MGDVVAFAPASARRRNTNRTADHPALAELCQYLERHKSTDAHYAQEEREQIDTLRKLMAQDADIRRHEAEAINRALNDADDYEDSEYGTQKLRHWLMFYCFSHSIFID